PETGQKMVTKLLLRSPDRSFSANPPSTSPSTTRPRPPSRRPSCPRWPGCRTRPRSPRRRPRRPTSTASSTTRATVYLLASKEHEAIVPLVTALVSYLARAAGRRLEPPLTLALDETYVTCPIPLDEWSSDMGGFNIQIVYVVQSPSQLRERYGESGAATILNNTTTLIQYGGSKNYADLEAISKLIGEREELVPTFDKHGKLTSKQVQKTPVITPSQLAQLGPHRAV